MKARRWQFTAIAGFLAVVGALFVQARLAHDRALVFTAASVRGASWQDDARDAGLLDADIAALKRDGLLVTNETYRQVFSAYLEGKRPTFVTSDSLLNAFHVLYEESVFRLEGRMARELPDILRTLLFRVEDADRHFRGRPELVAAAKRRALLTVGIALRLMDDDFRFGDPALDAPLDRDSAAVVAASRAGLPDWMGPPDRAFTDLDFSRYKPRGFYTANERLSRYFRAVSWLQSVPFRVDQDEELLAILMLGGAMTSRRADNMEQLERHRAFFHTYREFVGDPDDWDLLTAAQEAQDLPEMDLSGGGLLRVRERLMRKAQSREWWPLINDQLYDPTQFPPRDEPERFFDPNFRVVSAYRTPCAVLFQRTTDPRRFAGRLFPTGLEVAAVLGSTFARNTIEHPEKRVVLEVIDACKPHFDVPGLFADYLRTVGALFDKPPKAAPDFMKGEAWQRKSCNTALGGWAQLRHTWVLHAKQTGTSYGLAEHPPGFVEAVPEFYRRMAELVRETKSQLAARGALDADPTPLIEYIDRLAALAKQVEDEGEWGRQVRSSSKAHEGFQYLESNLMDHWQDETGTRSDSDIKEFGKWLESLSTKLRSGQPSGKGYLEEELRQRMYTLHGRWDSLEETCLRLEVMARKQLAGRELDSDDRAYIRRYGTGLAWIMLYQGNTYLGPHDDAPRIVDVYAAHGVLGVPPYLHVGVARPRKMYVLHPWQGGLVLCEGAVMPYYEFADADRLTDDIWRERLGGPQRPAVPAWMGPIVRGGDLGPPRFVSRR